MKNDIKRGKERERERGGSVQDAARRDAWKYIFNSRIFEVARPRLRLFDKSSIISYYRSQRKKEREKEYEKMFTRGLRVRKYIRGTRARDYERNVCVCCMRAIEKEYKSERVGVIKRKENKKCEKKKKEEEQGNKRYKIM